MATASSTNPYGQGLITKSNASKLFMNAKCLYDSNQKKIKMPRGSTCPEPPIGWYMSEKYDGYRAMWDGSRFVSRQGNVYNAPEWFTRHLPKNVVLDGELYAGRENFQMCGAVRHKVPVDKDWYNIVYQAYDVPSEFDKPFSTRYSILHKTIEDAKSVWDAAKDTPAKLRCPYRFTPHTEIKSEKAMKKFYDTILGKGGEGIMLKCPTSLYEGKRSSYLLKYKPNFDAEAMIIGYNYGTGKYSGILGSFICAPIKDEEVINDKKLYFSISGMNDHIRKSYKTTHPIGTIVTYTYAGMTDVGIPRFAQYSRIREDIAIKGSHSPDKVQKEKKKKTTKSADPLLQDKIPLSEIPTPVSYNDKKALISIFKTLETFEKENREHFKARVYKKTIDALEDLPGDVIEHHHIDTITSVRGIGKKIGEKIAAFIETGTIPMYDKIKSQDKLRDIKETLGNIYGIGHVKAKELVEKHDIKSLDELRKHPELLNSKQTIGLKYYEELLERIPRVETIAHEKYIVKVFNDIGAQAYVMGSYRRQTPDNGDIDVLVCSKGDDQGKYTQGIEILRSKGYLKEDLAFGGKKYMGICKLNGLRKNTRLNPKHRRIDIMFSTMVEAPFALLYFTGSADLNKKMRARALSMGYSINEHTIIDKNTKEPITDHKFKTEKDIFNFLKMDYIEPQNR
jgi:DNA polymerase/3'-5' exonuclease PolX